MIVSSHDICQTTARSPTSASFSFVVDNWYETSGCLFHSLYSTENVPADSLFQLFFILQLMSKYICFIKELGWVHFHFLYILSWELLALLHDTVPARFVSTRFGSRQVLFHYNSGASDITAPAVICGTSLPGISLPHSTPSQYKLTVTSGQDRTVISLLALR